MRGREWKNCQRCVADRAHRERPRDRYDGWSANMIARISARSAAVSRIAEQSGGDRIEPFELSSKTAVKAGPHERTLRGHLRGMT